MSAPETYPDGTPLAPGDSLEDNPQGGWTPPRFDAFGLPASPWRPFTLNTFRDISGGVLHRYGIEARDYSRQGGTAWMNPTTIVTVPNHPDHIARRIVECVAVLPHALDALAELVAEADNGHHDETGAVVLARGILERLETTP